jgi:hypothetical protein
MPSDNGPFVTVSGISSTRLRPMSACEHGQTVIAKMTTTLGGEEWFCARDVWRFGWFTEGWPPTPEPGQRLAPFVRHFTGPPSDDTLIYCECACRHVAEARWADLDPTGGYLRCSACVAEGHDLPEE